MRTVYLGTSGFAAAVLRVLAGSEHRPALVVTRPDRPRGRGRRLSSPPVADVARELDIDLVQPEQVNAESSRAQIAAVAPDVVVVCAFGALIKEPLLTDFEMLNVHPSLLPRWRGAAPIERAIMAGDERTGVSIMRLTAGLDSGPVCAQVDEPIRPDDTYGTLAARLQPLGASLLVNTLDARPPCVAQDETGVTYAEKLTAEDRLLDLTQPVAELDPPGARADAPRRRRHHARRRHPPRGVGGPAPQASETADGAAERRSAGDGARSRRGIAGWPRAPGGVR